MSSPAQVAAHRALWSSTHGSKRLPKVLVQEKLVTYYESRGEAVTELNLTPETGFLDEWRLEWDATLKDAGIDSPADRLKTVGWIESKAGGPPRLVERSLGLYEPCSPGLRGV